MKLFHTRPFVLAIITLSLAACGGGSETDPVPDNTTTPTTVELSGQFQKGPFIVGTEITIQELNTDLTPTGRSFQTETTSNLGDYLLPISLTSSLVEVSANGYYFNEVTGALSNGTLRLSALADTSDNTTININILTHLAKKRIRALVATGSTFSEAKQQAETEVRSLFSFDDSNTTLASFDQMDISQTGGSNAFLLLASSIFQTAYESSAELSEFIESISQDLSGDGTVNDNAITDLISTTELTIELEVIRTNLETKYSSLGQSVIIPNFESLINRAPVAQISEIQPSTVDSPLTLNGGLSFDIDNDTLTYSWSLIDSPEGSIASLSDEDTVTPSITPDKLGTYTVGLTVNDGELTSTIETVIISPNNQLPIALAGEDQELILGEQIILDGSNSYDPEGGELTYIWTNNQTSDTSTNEIWNASGIFTPTSSQHSITFTLTITDELGLESSDQLAVDFIPASSDAGFIYDVNRTIGEGMVTGYIQYGAGTFGYIGESGVIDWDITITSPTLNSGIPLNISMEGGDKFSTGGLIVSEWDLSFYFAQTGSSTIFQDTPGTKIYWCLDSGSCANIPGAEVIGQNTGSSWPDNHHYMDYNDSLVSIASRRLP